MYSTDSLPTGHQAKLEIFLLGSLQVKVAGQPTGVFAYDKIRALLAYLAAVPNAEHSRETLAAMLWPEQGHEDAKRNLRLAIFNLRRALGDGDSETPYLIASQKKLGFNPAAPIWLDLTEFEILTAPCSSAPDADHCRLCIARMERQVALYRGPFLDGLHVADAQEFEDWLQARREFLRRQALVLLERLADCHEQAGDYLSAQRHAERYAVLEPWDENGHRRLMRLLALSGGNGAALAHYEATRLLLERDLGVLPEERTRALANAIRDGKFAPAEIRKPPSARPSASIAERRQVSVLYCDLTVAASDDPEEALALLCDPQARCVEIIGQFSGHIVQRHGGGLLAYFGYPQADEHAARRAVQAALAVMCETTHGIEIRAGVHTGLVVTGGGSSMPDTSGGTSRLAIQLRHGVAHNEVAISRETHRIVAGYFDCIELGVQLVPGIERPVEVFKVTGESGARTRLDAAAQLTPLAGRKVEIAELMRLWQQSAHGASRVVLLRGEAGIGKSRLLLALKERLADQPHAIHELHCFPELSQSPFHPLIAAIEATLGFAHEDTPEAKFGKLAEHLEVHFPASAQEAIPLLAPLLSLPLAEPYLATGLPPQKQKEQTIAVLLDLLRISATEQPVLLILEDLHWIDPSTLEFLSPFVEQTGNRAILVLLTARPEFLSPWKDALKITLELGPLLEDEVIDMISSINTAIPAATVARIVARADGVPLFAEEMAKIATLDNQAVIPATLHDLLAARIDAAGEAKTVAQEAATLGRECTFDMLMRITEFPQSVVVQLVDKLRNAGLLADNGENIQFRHALIQEVAYQSQSKSTRQATHRRIARILRDDNRKQIEARPEVLARHLTLGGEIEQALEYWLKAGQLAARGFFNREAADHFGSGLALIRELPEGSFRDNLEFQLLIGRGASLQLTEGWTSPGAERDYSSAMAMGGRIEDSLEIFQALWGLWKNTAVGKGPKAALDLAQNLLRLALHIRDRAQLIHARFALGTTLMWVGDQDGARTHLAQGYQDYTPALRDDLMRVAGEDSGLSCGIFLSSVLWFSGYPDQARRVCVEALEYARLGAAPNDLGCVLFIASVVSRYLVQAEPILAFTEELLALSDEHGLLQWRDSAILIRGWALTIQGRPEGIGIMKQGMVSLKMMLQGLHSSVLSFLPEVGARDPRESGAGISTAEMSLEKSKLTGECYINGELLRLKGECLLTLSPDNAQQAQACFEQALVVTRAQNAKSFELRAATSLARLWLGQGKTVEAKHVLAEIYGRFSEGFDTHDLIEAKALL